MNWLRDWWQKASVRKRIQTIGAIGTVLTVLTGGVKLWQTWRRGDTIIEHNVYVFTVANVWYKGIPPAIGEKIMSKKNQTVVSLPNTAGSGLTDGAMPALAARQLVCWHDQDAKETDRALLSSKETGSTPLVIQQLNVMPIDWYKIGFLLESTILGVILIWWIVRRALAWWKAGPALGQTSPTLPEVR